MELSISRFGVSEALQAEFTMLREVQTSAGTPKYSRKTVDTLAQILICRNYGNACYELAHLSWAIIYHASQVLKNDANQTAIVSRLSKAIDAPVLNYFWVQQVSSQASFIDYFADHALSLKCDDLRAKTLSNQAGALESYMAMSLQGAKLDLSINGHSFILHGERANLWACLMEWLVCVSPDLLQLIEGSLQNKGQNAINELASQLQQAIYTYLSDHLPPAKLQRRYRQIDAWHQGHAEDSASQLSVDDESILQFWRQHKQLEGFTKYSFVFSEHLAYLQAKDMVHSQAMLAFANSIEDEQVRPVHDKDLLDLTDTEGSNEPFYSVFTQHQPELIADLAMLSTKPKVFKQEQVDLLQLLVHYPQQLHSVLRSWLRSMVFAKYQNQLIQAKRKQVPLKIENIVANPSDYQDLYSQSNKLIAHNQLTILALVDILLEMAPKEGLFLLAKLTQQLPSLKVHCEQLKHLFSQDQAFDESTLPTAQLKYPWFNALIKQCKQARSKIKRVGFTEKTKLSEDEYLHTASQLIALNKALSKILKTIRQQNMQSDDNFCSDRLIFINELRELYIQDGEQ